MLHKTAVREISFCRISKLFYRVAAVSDDAAPAVSCIAAVITTFLLAVSLHTPAGAAQNGHREVKMSEQTAAFLETVLVEPERVKIMKETLSADGAWGSLGPGPTGEPEPLPVRAPEREIELMIPEDAVGSGTEDDPYVDVISAYLQNFEYEPVSIEAYKRYPDEAQMQDIEAYIDALPYKLKTVIVPAGYYKETVKTSYSPHRHFDKETIGLDVPPGIWLRGEGEVVLEPVIPKGISAHLVNLNIRAGLENFVLDGSSVPGFEPEPETRLTGIVAAHGAVVAGNHIHDFTHHGIGAAGGRGRAGSDVIVSDNIIENIGRSGISAQSRWIIRDNRIRYAGVLRPDGGGGDDGIIPRWGVGGKIVNNLVILERRPHARHVISGQGSRDCLVAGNISIAIGPMRNNIGFSDGSHRNRFIGNVVLGVGDDYRGGHTLCAVSVNGYGTQVRHNFSVGHPRGIRTSGREGEELCIIADNYTEYMYDHIFRSSHYKAENNVSRQSGEVVARRHYNPPLPAIEDERMESEFGFFAR